jgi:hypothetical protein
MTTRFGSGAALWAVAALLGVAVPAAAEDFVVIESTTPQLAVGSMIAGGQAIALPANSRAVLAGDTGRTVSLAGPFSGPVAQGSAAGAGNGQLLTALAGLVRKKEADTSAVGAVRAADVAWRQEAATSLADVVAIDTGDGGEVCLYDPAKAELIRGPGETASRVNILNATSGAAATLDWGGARRLPWPQELPLEDGESYVFEQPGKPTAAVATVHVLPNEVPNDIARIAQLADVGCDGQARLLLAVVAKMAK